MIRFKTILYFLFILSLLEVTLKSCVFSGCEIIELPKTEKRRFEIYKKEKWAYSSGENLDTLTVLMYRDVYSPCNKWEVSNFQFNKIEVRFSSKLFSKKKWGDINVSLFAEENQKLSLLVAFINLRQTCHDDELKDRIDKIKIPSFADSLECYTFDTSNSSSEHNGIIESFSWSKEYGFLRYVTKEGEVFELQNSCF
jgi:hypothetical protein